VQPRFEAAAEPVDFSHGGTQEKISATQQEFCATKSQSAIKILRTRGANTAGAMDISLHNLTEDKVWSAALHVPLLDMMDLGLAVLRADGLFLQVNERMSEFLGYEREAFDHMSLLDLLSEEERSSLQDRLQRLQEDSHQTMKFEVRFFHQEGLPRIVNLSLLPIAESSGSLQHILAIFEDISIRKLNEELLQHQSQVLEMIARNQNLNQILACIVRLIEKQAAGALSTIYLLDQDRRLRLGAAPSWPESFIRTVDGTAIGPEAGSCGAAAYYGRQVISLDVSQDPCWGPFREWIMSYGIRSAWSTPVLAKDSSVLGTVSMCWREWRKPTERDLALLDMATRLMGFAIERKEAQDIIQQQQLKLIASSKMAALGEMAGGVSHEINNPLTVIHGFAQKLELLAGRDTLDREAVRDIARNIRKGAHRISKIVKGLRAIARGSEHDPFQLIPLQTIMDDTLELCRERIVKSGIQLELDPIPADLHLECRAEQIAQVLLNLLNNAYDALQNMQERWIRVTVNGDAEWITLTVSDSGPGIPSELQEQIMQPFFTTKKAGHGTGLGLSISRSIVNAHRGHLYLDAKCSTTRFVITLPRYQSSAAERSSHSAPDPMTSSSRS
jgi:PAS domain S-box-containing protein